MKVPFTLKDRKKMVQDLEEVQYDDVVQMAIQRFEAGLHLERYKSRREFVSIICRDPAAQTLTACIMGIVLAFLDMYRSCMKGKKGVRFANFQQKWFEHISDYMHVDKESKPSRQRFPVSETGTSRRSQLRQRAKHHPARVAEYSPSGPHAQECSPWHQAFLHVDVAA